MDWKRQLTADESELKVLVEQLGAARRGGLHGRAERQRASRSLNTKLVEMHSYVQDFLSGRSAHERAVLEYRLRVEYPLYSHLSSLSTLSREYVEWSCA
jgi:hypothetical protein